MSRLVKDFDNDCKDGNYIVKKVIDENLPAVIVYDNRIGSDTEYYSIFGKVIRKIRKAKNYYILYI